MIVADATAMVAMTLVGRAPLVWRLLGKVKMTASSVAEMAQVMDVFAPGLDLRVDELTLVLADLRRDRVCNDHLLERRYPFALS